MEQSFTSIIKEELIEIEYSEEEIQCILAAFLRQNGNVIFANRQTKLLIRTENNHVAKFIYHLLKNSKFDLQLSFRYRRKMNLNKNIEYLINVENNVDALLNYSEIVFLDSRSIYSYINTENKIKAYLIGLFLASGSCNNPASGNYHFEIIFKDEDYANAVIKLLRHIKSVKPEFKEIQRRNNFVLYVKKSETITDLLAFLGASNAYLEYENIRIDREFTNSQNRLINCDAFNFKKTLDKSLVQIEKIKLLDKNLGINSIGNAKIKELCHLRLENPEASYNELAILLSKKMETKISKSNISQLFKKIDEMVDKYGY